MRRKDQVHFETKEGGRGPIETIFKPMVFEPLIFGTFGEMSSNVRELIEMAVEYGVEHLGRNMAVTSMDIVR
jgi:hypothetical protein